MMSPRIEVCTELRDHRFRRITVRHVDEHDARWAEPNRELVERCRRLETLVRERGRFFRTAVEADDAQTPFDGLTRKTAADAAESYDSECRGSAAALRCRSGRDLRHVSHHVTLPAAIAFPDGTARDAQRNENDAD